MCSDPLLTSVGSVDFVAESGSFGRKGAPWITSDNIAVGAIIATAGAPIASFGPLMPSAVMEFTVDVLGIDGDGQVVVGSAMVTMVVPSLITASRILWPAWLKISMSIAVVVVAIINVSSLDRPWEVAGKADLGARTGSRLYLLCLAEQSAYCFKWNHISKAIRAVQPQGPDREHSASHLAPRYRALVLCALGDRSNLTLLFVARTDGPLPEQFDVLTVQRLGHTIRALPGPAGHRHAATGLRGRCHGL